MRIFGTLPFKLKLSAKIEITPPFRWGFVVNFGGATQIRTGGKGFAGF
jgi:hypothetical protein